MLGGDGEDHISSFRGASIVIDAGAGPDRVSLNFLGAQIRVTLGSGSDMLSLNRNYDDRAGGSITVTDFETGPAGDRLEIAAHLASVIAGFDPGTSPFASQHLLLVQVGPDTLLRLDRDGPADPRASPISFASRIAVRPTSRNSTSAAIIPTVPLRAARSSSEPTVMICSGALQAGT